MLGSAQKRVNGVIRTAIGENTSNYRGFTSIGVVRKDGNETVVEVDHVEGNVVNILRDISSTRADLVEFKRRYEATFVNEFSTEGEGMRYTLTASVRLKWPYRLAAPFVKPVVLARMRRYVVEPLKAAAEIER